MGAGSSGLATDDQANCQAAKPSSTLGGLPESCIALVLSRLDPCDIFTVSCVNRTFRRASMSDTVWASKLPENHHVLVKKLLVRDDKCLNMNSFSKKEIYARISRPMRLPGDPTKEVWLDRYREGICMAISWKGLKITGIDDRRYWTHISTDESRFHTVAYLQQMWWLEIGGNVEFEFPVGTYSLFFRFQLGRPATKGSNNRRRLITENPERIHGWNSKPVKFQLSTSNGQHATSQCFLKVEHGKWVHHHVGDFVVEDSNFPTVLKFSMTQIDCTHTKGGLCLDSVFILPAGNQFDKVLKQF